MAAPEPMIREQAALYLQIQQWLDLEAKLRELQAQVEKATQAELAAEMRAAQATQEAVLARAELAAANQRITALMAEPEEEDAVEDTKAALEQANGTIAELRRQLETRDQSQQIVQAIEALKAQANQQAPGPTPDFDIIIQRNSEGFLQKLTVKEKDKLPL